MPNHGDRIDALERFTQSIAADIQSVKADNQEVKAAVQQTRQSQEEMQATLALILNSLPAIAIGSTSSPPPAPPLLIPSSSSVPPLKPPDPIPPPLPFTYLGLPSSTTSASTTIAFSPLLPHSNPPPTKRHHSKPTPNSRAQSLADTTSSKILQILLKKEPPLHPTKTASSPPFTSIHLKPPDPNISTHRHPNLTPPHLPFTPIGMPSSTPPNFTTSASSLPDSQPPTVNLPTQPPFTPVPRNLGKQHYTPPVFSVQKPHSTQQPILGHSLTSNPPSKLLQNLPNKTTSSTPAFSELHLHSNVNYSNHLPPQKDTKRLEDAFQENQKSLAASYFQGNLHGNALKWFISIKTKYKKRVQLQEFHSILTQIFASYVEEPLARYTHEFPALPNHVKICEQYRTCLSSHGLQPKLPKILANTHCVMFALMRELCMFPSFVALLAHLMGALAYAWLALVQNFTVVEEPVNTTQVKVRLAKIGKSPDDVSMPPGDGKKRTGIQLLLFSLYLSTNTASHPPFTMPYKSLLNSTQTHNQTKNQPKQQNLKQTLQSSTVGRAATKNTWKIGVKGLDDTVRLPMGPQRRNVILEQSYRHPEVTKGVLTVTKSIALQEQIKNIPSNLMKQVAYAANDNCTRVLATQLSRALNPELICISKEKKKLSIETINASRYRKSLIYDLVDMIKQYSSNSTLEENAFEVVQQDSHGYDMLRDRKQGLIDLLAQPNTHKQQQQMHKLMLDREETILQLKDLRHRMISMVRDDIVTNLKIKAKRCRPPDQLTQVATLEDREEKSVVLHDPNSNGLIMEQGKGLDYLLAQAITSSKQSAELKKFNPSGKSDLRFHEDTN